MAEKDVNQRQIVINLHTGETGKTESLANKLNLGELAVEHVSGENARLHVLRGDGTVGTFIESADTYNAIEAAITEVEGYVEAQGFAYSANLQTLSASVVNNYWTSAETESAISDAKDELIGETTDESGATTIYGAKAYADEKVKQAVAGSVNGAVGGNYINVEVVENVALISADTQTVADADASNMGLAEASDVKAYVDAAEESAYERASGYTNQEINTLSGVAHTEIVSAITESKEYTDDQIDALSSATETAIATAKQEAIDAASGYTDDQISALKGDATESGDTLGKLEDRIEQIEAGGVRSVTADEESGTYVKVSVTGDSQNPVVAVEDTVVDITAATASNKGLAEAYDVKSYVDEAEADAVAAASAYTNTVSGNIETTINTVSGNIETKINTVSGNIETTINTVSGNIETTINNFSAGTVGEIARLDGIIASAQSDSEVVLSAYTQAGQVTEGYLKTYEIFQGGESVGKIDIPKDLVVNSGGTIEIGGAKYIRLYIANDPEHPIDIPVADLAHVYNKGDGIEISTGDVVSAKVVAANGLSVDSNGIAMALADASNNGAMSSADFTKLAGLESGAQVNVIETVKVNGTPLSVEDKAVDVTVAEGATDGTIAVNGDDVAVHGLGSAAFEDTDAFDEAGAADAVSAAVTSNYATSADTVAAIEAVVAGAVTAATGDSLVSAVDSGNTIFVSATQDLTDAVAKANSALQSIAAEGDSYVSATASSISSITVTTTVADLTDTTDGLVDAADAREYIANAVSAESVTRETADEALSDRIDDEVSARTAADTALGERIDNEVSARTAADQALSDRIDAITSGTVLSVTKKAEGGDGSYVTITVDNTNAQNPVISVSDDIQAVASADASNMGLAEASDVKGYVDGEVSGLSGNLITYTNTEIETLSGNVIGNAESTSADTTILGVKAYVDEKVAEKNVNATGDTYVIASADSNTVHVEASQAVKDAADGAVLSVTSGNTANVTISNHEIDFNNMIIDCGTY